MKPTSKNDVLRGHTALCALLGATLLWFSQPAHAVNYEGAFYVDTPEAVQTLQSRGFNLFIVGGDILAVLAAITPPSGGIINLNGYDDAGGMDFMNWLRTKPEYSKVVAIETFSEPNTVVVDLSRQRAWYSWLKSTDPSKYVFEIFYVEADGLHRKDLIDRTPGLSWDFVMVYAYPYWWGLTDAQAISNVRAGAVNVASWFGTSTFIIPLLQGAGCSVPGPTQRPPPNAMDEYTEWRNAGCLTTSHAIFYYGWQTAPEDLNLQTPAFLDAATAQIAYHKSLYP